MHFVWFSSSFLIVLKFLQIKEVGPNFWVAPILQKVGIIWRPLLYLNFKSCVDLNSPSFIRFECILHDLRSTFLWVLKFLQIKEGRPNFSGQPILQKVCIIWSPLLYFNFKSIMDPNYWSLIRLQKSTFFRVLKFQQIKEGGPTFWGEPILKKVSIIWSPLLYFNFNSIMDPNSSSLIRFQCIPHDLGVLFS